jgi:hypothetical protein
MRGSIVPSGTHTKGGHNVNQYETIGVVLGVVIFSVILLAGIVVGRKEHA